MSLPQELSVEMTDWSGNMKKIFVNGSFDVLHSGHIDLLNTAKNMGDYLLVAIDSDRHIQQKKGADRPFNNQHNRLTLMRNIRSVDQVLVFDSDDELAEIIKNFAPDIMVKGSDWRGKPIVGEQYVKEIVFYERINNESTTNTIESYLDRRQLHR